MHRQFSLPRRYVSLPIPVCKSKFLSCKPAASHLLADAEHEWHSLPTSHARFASYPSTSLDVLVSPLHGRVSGNGIGSAQPAALTANESSLSKSALPKIPDKCLEASDIEGIGPGIYDCPSRVPRGVLCVCCDKLRSALSRLTLYPRVSQGFPYPASSVFRSGSYDGSSDYNQPSPALGARSESVRSERLGCPPSPDPDSQIRTRVLSSDRRSRLP